jgi:hypothetical protein
MCVYLWAGAYAYQNAFLPPENIERLHPNLAVVMATVWRYRRLHPELNNPAKRDIDPIRRAWGKKVSSGVIYNWEYYLYPRLKDDGWHGTPVWKNKGKPKGENQRGRSSLFPNSGSSS